MKNLTETKNEYYTKTALKQDHGFSENLIKKLLGEADKRSRNPYSRNKPDVQLYLTERVEECKELEAWINYQEQRIRRSEAARKTQETKREKTLEFAKTCPINWEEYTPVNIQEAIQEGWDSWTYIQNERGNYRNIYESGTPDEKTLHRWAVNYLRHHCLMYEETLFDTKGRTGVDEAYYIIKDRCLDMISERFPELKDECYRQYHRMYEYS